MADKRMFSKSIIDSDHFLDMPVSAQCLYFHLAMRADDDGFVNCAKKIMRLLGASDDDMKLLSVKQYVIPFRSGVMVIRHWRMHNLLRPDRYKQTEYQDEMKCLVNEKGKPYALISASDNQMATDGIPDGNQTATQYRLDKDRIDKCSVDDGRQSPTAPASNAVLPFGTELGEGEISASLARDREIEDACKDWGLPCNPGNMIHARDLARDYGMEWLLEAIKRAGNGKSQTWAYVDGILRSFRQKGGMDEPGSGKAVGKTVSAQQYGQRQYTENELLSVSNDLLAEARAMRDRK